MDIKHTKTGEGLEFLALEHLNVNKMLQGYGKKCERIKIFS